MLRAIFILLLVARTTALAAPAPAPPAKPPAPAGAGDPPGSGRLGKYGNLRTLPIEGTKTIPAEVLRKTLAKDWALQVLLAPSAPVEEFKAVIATRARDGYLASGFPSPTVQVRLDDAGNPTGLIVDEGGLRRRQGRVRVEGAHGIAVDELIAILTDAKPAKLTRTPFVIDINPEAATARIDGFDPEAPPPGKPLWETGKWASFHPNWPLRQRRKVAQAFARLGFFQAKFTVAVVPPEDANVPGDAELVVTISDEGPRARLSGIDIDGLRRNPRDAVIAAMGLKENQPVDLRALLVAQQALWDTGRFKKHAMRLEQDAKDTTAGNMRLKLDVREHGTLPLLTESLSREQQALLRFGQWMEQFDRGEDELLVTLDIAGLSGDFVLTSRGEWVTHFRDESARANPPAPAGAATAATKTATRALTTAAPTTTSATAPFDYAFAATSDAVALFDLPGGRHIDAAGLGEPAPNCQFVAFPNFGNDKNWKQLVVGATVKIASGPNQPAFQCVLAPAVLLDALEPEEGVAATTTTTTTTNPTMMRPAARLGDDGVLEVRGGGWVTKIDAATGRLIELTGAAQGATIRISTCPRGEVAARVGALLQRTPRVIHLQNADDLQPAIELVTTLLGALPLPPQWREPLQPVARLTPAAAPLAVLLRPLAQAAIAECESLETRGGGADGGGAGAAGDLEFVFAPPPPGVPTDFTALCGIAGAIVADATAPRGHWAWTTIRESMLLRGGEFRSAGREISRLQAEERVGPVAAMMIARSPLGAPRPAAMFARDALAMPEPAALVEDLRFLVEGQTALSRGLRGSAEALRTMSDADVQAIARVLSPPVASRFVRIAAQLKQRRDEPVEKVLLDALGQLWTPAMRDRLIADLSAISQGKRP